MRADGDREALRLLMTGRDHAVASCKSARTALAAVLVTAPAPLREQLRHLPRERRARACAALDCPPGADRQTRVLHQTLARLGQRIAGLTGTAAGIEAQITAIAGDMTPGLVAAEPGLGALSAAQILLSWSHAGRIRSEAAFAMLSGTAPVPRLLRPHRPPPPQPARRPPAQQGTERHRRQPHALPPATQSYIQRRRAERRTDREIRRCIKRYIARHLYRTLTSGGNSTPRTT
jgi:hypothetical protein